MSDDKKKAVLYGAVGALVIIILLLWWKRGGRTIFQSQDGDWSLGDFFLPESNINVTGFDVPDLASYYPVGSCGCGCGDYPDFEPPSRNPTGSLPRQYFGSAPVPAGRRLSYGR